MEVDRKSYESLESALLNPSKATNSEETSAAAANAKTTRQDSLRTRLTARMGKGVYGLQGVEGREIPNMYINTMQIKNDAIAGFGGTSLHMKSLRVKCTPDPDASLTMKREASKPAGVGGFGRPVSTLRRL